MPGPARRRGQGRKAELRRRRAIHDHGGDVSVIMAAWNASRYILEALQSIRGQRPRAGWEYGLRIGVDACEATSRFLLRAGVTHWWSPQNVGPYIMRNSLIALAPCTAYAIFDADDRMRDSYLHELLAWVGSNGIAGAGRTQIKADGSLIKRRTGYKSGVCVISHEAWTKLGAYRPWPMAADYDLIIRANKLGVPVRAVKKSLYMRRVHEGSLTQRPDTGFKSQQRKEFASRARSLSKHAHNLYVHPVTTPLELRAP